MTATGPIVVVALGGNATYPPDIRGTAEEQFAIAHRSSESLVAMHEAGYRLVLTHGNGPVVGRILMRMAISATQLTPMPMDICVAHSQGGIGYILQQSLANVLCAHGRAVQVASVVTRVVVDVDDPAFRHPTKPVGPFYAAEQAERVARETGWAMAEDSGRGYRRVVPSPEPRAILEIDVVRLLLNAGAIPIVAGGGGIPVVLRSDGMYEGVAAVVDKDLTSAVLAADLGADALIILTGVDRVALDFGKPTQRPVDRLTVREAERHLAGGQFPEGSMGPKIRAAIRFVAQGGRTAVITSLERGLDALRGTAGTRLVA
jgi:carbamate kinase